VEPTRLGLAWLTARNVGFTTSARAAIARVERQAMSGVRVERASDAPAEWAGLQRLHARRADAETWGGNADRALGSLDAADIALGEGADLLKRAWQLVVGAASEPAGDEALRANAIELQGLRESLLAVANRSFDGQALFAGAATDGPAFDATGAYLGSPERVLARVGEREQVAVAFDGAAIFQGGEDVIALMDAARAAMDARDPDALAALLDGFEAAHGQLVAARAEIGSHQRRAEDATHVNASFAALYEGLATERAAIDEVATYTQLASLRTAYEATLAVTARSASSSLFQYLR
jgi:flagellar hook-associated protein 3 FlgL